MKKGKLKVSYTDGFGYSYDNYYEVYVCEFEGHTYYIDKRYKEVTTIEGNETITESPQSNCNIYNNTDYLDELVTHFGEGATNATVEWLEELAEVEYEPEYYTKAEVDEMVKDTGWCEVTLDSNFVRYNENYRPLAVRKIGKVVYMSGSVRPLEAFTPTGDVSHRIGIMPSGFAPTYPEIIVCQGSGAKKFVLFVHPNRGIYISRYSDDSVQNNEIPFNSWLNCYGSWLHG